MSPSRTTLTTERVLHSGFHEVGCWELTSARDLDHRIELPSQAGVYAFAIDGVVQYVGLASKSLRQRLGFYRKPGASQRTNVRLNEIIRGHIEQGIIVQVLIAHPPDYDWNGLKISGAEGLEAGLIAEFDLPWNLKGASSATGQQILEFVQKRPGMTELEIAKQMYGPTAVQQQVNQQCRSLLKDGLLERRGRGGVSDPFVYYPAAPEAT